MKRVPPLRNDPDAPVVITGLRRDHGIEDATGTGGDAYRRGCGNAAFPGLERSRQPAFDIRPGIGSHADLEGRIARDIGDRHRCVRVAEPRGDERDAARHRPEIEEPVAVGGSETRPRRLSRRPQHGTGDRRPLLGVANDARHLEARPELIGHAHVGAPRTLAVGRGHDRAAFGEPGDQAARRHGYHPRIGDAPGRLVGHLRSRAVAEGRERSQLQARADGDRDARAPLGSPGDFSVHGGMRIDGTATETPSRGGRAEKIPAPTTPILVLM